MTPIAYALQFRGRASGSLPGPLVFELSAPSCAFVTNVLASGLRGHCELAAGREARLRSEVSLEEDDGFRASGTISLGGGHEFRFRMLESARFEPSPDPHLKHASLISEVLGGEGQFDRASGRIVSNVLLSDTGEVTDYHLGVIFVEERP
jgi:hypothetical protein